MKALYRVALCLAAVLCVISSVICPVLGADAAGEGGEIAFTDEEQEYVSAHRTVKVGFVPDRIPVSFADENGDPAGISKYIFDRVSELTGIEFVYEALPTKSVTYKYLIGHGFDLITSVEYNEENKVAKGIIISDPYLSARKVMVARSDHPDFDSDKSWDAAVSTGSQTLKKVLKRYFPNFNLKDYDSITDCFDAVNSGDADLLILNQYVVEYWMNKPRYEKLKVIPVMELDDEMCFSAVFDMNGEGIGPTREEGQTLVNILDKAIDTLSEDEKSNFIIQGVMENQYEYRFSDFISRYRYAVVTLCVSVVIIAVLAVILIRQRLKFAESKAEARAKGRFLSTMSHEIRTPLNGLIGLNHLMSREIGNTAKMEEYINRSSETAEYLLSLVNDILDSSELEENRIELSVGTVDLETVFETIDTIERDAMEKKLIRYTFEGDIACRYIKGDFARIQQVILNLLDNACKFTNRGGTVKMTVTQEITGADKVFTKVVVADTGKGMSEEFQKQVFDVFSRELDTVSKGNQGTGLGLAISYRLAKLMGGDLTCESKKGEGSTFTFTFTADPSTAPEKKDIMPLAESGDLPRVLVAEDNELNGEIIIELLRSYGFRADLAENGAKALKMFRNSPVGTYGVILMDLMMPEMDGFEAAKAIRRLNRDDARSVRIFACTANDLPEEKQKASESGMDDFIAKPLDVGQLLEKLRGEGKKSSAEDK